MYLLNPSDKIQVLKALSKRLNEKGITHVAFPSRLALRQNLSESQICEIFGRPVPSEISGEKFIHRLGSTMVRIVKSMAGVVNVYPYAAAQSSTILFIRHLLSEFSDDADTTVKVETEDLCYLLAVEVKSATSLVNFLSSGLPHKVNSAAINYTFLYQGVESTLQTIPIDQLQSLVKAEGVVTLYIRINPHVI